MTCDDPVFARLARGGEGIGGVCFGCIAPCGESSELMSIVAAIQAPLAGGPWMA